MSSPYLPKTAQELRYLLRKPLRNICSIDTSSFTWYHPSSHSFISAGDKVAKSKTALMSLGAKGTIGGGLTFQEGKSATIVRSKPTPTYRRTLLQQYQRWLYQDYAYLWTQQSPATQAHYRTLAVRFHRTAFQHWMSVMLATLPDRNAIYHLDNVSTGQVIDSSPYANIGNPVGVTSVPATIYHGSNFDGIDDNIALGSQPQYNLSVFTAQFFYTPTTLGDDGILGNFRIGASYSRFGWSTRLNVPGDELIFYIGNGTINSACSFSPVVAGTKYLITISWDGTTQTLIVGDNPPVIQTPPAFTIDYTNVTAFIGHVGNIGKAHALFDEYTIFNRILDSHEITRNSLRRYP